MPARVRVPHVRHVPDDTAAVSRGVLLCRGHHHTGAVSRQRVLHARVVYLWLDAVHDRDERLCVVRPSAVLATCASVCVGGGSQRVLAAIALPTTTAAVQAEEQVGVTRLVLHPYRV